MDKRLEGVRVAVLAADGFEQAEVTVPLRALKAAGAEVRVLSYRPGRLKGLNFVWPGGKLPVDDTVGAAEPDDYGAVYLPGGFVGPDLLRQSAAAQAFVQKADALGRPIAVLCHGAQLLVSARLVHGRKITSWPGIAEDLKNAGARWLDAPLVRERNWVSSRGPQDFGAFVPAMVDLFDEQAPRALSELQPRLRWVATGTRLAGWAVLGLVALEVLRPLLGLRRRRRGVGALVLPLLAAGAARWVQQQRFAGTRDGEEPSPSPPWPAQDEALPEPMPAR